MSESEQEIHPLKKIMNGWFWLFILTISATFAAGVYVGNLNFDNDDSKSITKRERELISRYNQTCNAIRETPYLASNEEARSSLLTYCNKAENY